MISEKIVQTTHISDNQDNAQKVFLGSWCSYFSEDEKYLNRALIPYHWDDRKKIKNDFIYLQRLNLDLIKDLSLSLNKIHNLEENTKYWDQIIGSWLNLLTAVLYDRWSMINFANDYCTNCTFEYLKFDYKYLTSNSSKEFGEVIFDDAWNSGVFSLIIDYLKISNRKHISFDYFHYFEDLNLRNKKNYKKILTNSLNFLSGLFCKNDKYFYIGTYLSRLNQIKIFKKIRFWNELEIRDLTLDSELRKCINLDKELEDEFEKFVRKKIRLFLPKIFLEGYKDYKDYILKQKLPKNPKIIFTSSNHFFDDSFNIWSAEKRKDGSRLIIGEHGNIGMSAINSANEFQIRISDRFISSGWKRKEEKIYPVGNFRVLNKKIKPKKNSNFLLITNSMKQYSGDLRSMVVAGQMEKYFSYVNNFLKLLNKDSCEKIRLRVSPEDNNWFQKQRFSAENPLIKYDNEKKSLKSSLRKSNLLISSYPSTPFIDTLSMDYPVVLFFDQNLWEIHPEYKKDINELKRVKIFHENEQSAAEHINNISRNVFDWWDDFDTRNTRLKFIEKFAECSDITLLKFKESIK